MIAKAAILLPYTADQKSEITFFPQFQYTAFNMLAIILPLVKPHNPDPWKRSLINFWTALCGLVLVSISGIIGYILFENASEDVVLDNFSSKNHLIIVMQVGFFIVVTCSFPCIGQ